MKFYVAVTDDAWFRYLQELDPQPDEINFWTGSPANHLPGTPWLFKLHSPNDFIVGGGYFTYFTQMPLSIAWETFEQKNGVASLGALTQAIAKYRRSVTIATPIGCAVLSQPFFWDRNLWLRIPENWSKNIVTRKSYETEEPSGAKLWQAVKERIPRPVIPLQLEAPGGYGKPQLVAPRLGQGAFRFMVTDAYRRRCAVSGERALPALDAAHIVPFTDSPLTHEVRNGLLLRADIHRLFDLGYVTVAPDYRFLVSKTIRDDFHNGEDYYRFHGSSIALPDQVAARPDKTFLDRHASTRFRG